MTVKLTRNKELVIRQMVQLHLQGLNDSQIAKEIGRAKSLVSYYKRLEDWEIEVKRQKNNLVLLQETVIEQSQTAIIDYKERLRQALGIIDKICRNQLETARIGQETCLAFMGELQLLYESEGVALIEKNSRAIRAISDLQRSINETVRSAIEETRFTTQLDTVYNYFVEKNINGTTFEFEE